MAVAVAAAATTSERAIMESPSLAAPVQENLEVLYAFEERDDAEVSRVQTLIEKISAFFGSPAYFAFVLLFITAWVLVNEWGLAHGWRHVDEPPFFWLQGLVSSNALLLTVAVLIRQNRMAILAQHRAHLDLQINLLTEQKVSKLLGLVDDLRRGEGVPPEAPLDPADQGLTEPADPEAILTAIKETSRRR
jgi:uncharacterized membrane protein